MIFLLNPQIRQKKLMYRVALILNYLKICFHEVKYKTDVGLVTKYIEKLWRYNKEKIMCLVLIEDPKKTTNSAELDWKSCLTLYTLKLVHIFSILLPDFLSCWQGEFVWQSRASLAGDHSFYYCNLGRVCPRLCHRTISLKSMSNYG